MKRLAVLALLMSVVLASVANAADAPLFVAEGFVVTQEDVNRLRDCYEGGALGMAMFSSEAEYRKKALDLRLLSGEAVAQGLDEGANEGLDTDDPFFQEKRMLRLSKRYINHLIKTYPVSDRVILSYYRANPERYGASPLNDTVREEVRMKVAVAKQKSIQEAEIDRLMTKYHVQTVSETRK